MTENVLALLDYLPINIQGANLKQGDKVYQGDYYQQWYYDDDKHIISRGTSITEH